MNYQPLPNDVFTIAGHKPVTVLRVFPTEIVTSQEGMEDKKTPLALFHTQLEAAVKKGAIVSREGIQIYPPIAQSEIPPIAQSEIPPIAQSEIPPITESEIPNTPMTTPSNLTGSSNTHARLSPSDSKRWTNCTASIAFQEANAHRVVDSSSREADEGTEAHEWAAKVLMEQITISQIPEPFTDPVSTYVLHCRDLTTGIRTSLATCIEEADLGFEPPENAYFVEEEIPLFYQPEQHGTADWVSLKSENGVVTHLYGRDYKHGAGVLVTTEENTQLAIYVYSAICRLSTAYKFTDDTVIDLAVVQPRHRESEYQNSWVITLADLRTFCESITGQAAVAREAAEIVREYFKNVTSGDVECQSVITILQNADSPAIFNPSEGDSGACRWCKCKAFCSVRLRANTEAMELSTMDGAELLSAMPDMSKEEMKQDTESRLTTFADKLQARDFIMDDAYLVNLVARKKGITTFLNDAEEYLEARLLRGDEIEGVKLVEGREGNRDWISEESADTFLRGQGLKQEERYKFTLQSPAVIEKMLKDKLKKTARTKSRFEELITRSPAKKKLAIADDKRESVAPLIAAMPNEDFEV